MSIKIKQQLEKLILSSPGLRKQPALMQRILFRKKVAILMYHGVVRTPLDVSDWCFVSERDFYQQMEYLYQNLNVVSLSRAAEDLRENRIREPTAVITFDDGYQNVYDVAYPVLSGFELPATVFLNTAFTDTANTIWFCTLNQAISETTHKSLLWNGQSYDLTSSEAKSVASARLQSILKEYSHEVLLEKVADIRRQLDVHTPAAVAGDSPFRLLCRHSILEMSASGLIEFGAHTANHTILTRVDKIRARQEIESSIADAQRLCGMRCKHFAYPNGRAADYDGDAIKLLEGAGVEAAVTTRPGPNTSATPALELRRYGVGDKMSFLRFVLQVHHLQRQPQ